ncbi:MAG: DUF362 domain-containing protein [Candidatus Omnitrophica bacterium]|nr:DUF362 domain-containing protein [Candidatus Omnitrophota bacterium]MBU4479378.1 DUF362 domain-containing protein [Candidatus Omnitrophota bacterium]
MPQVSVVRCRDYDGGRLFSEVKKSVDLIGGIKRFVKPGQKVLLKPNLLKIAAAPEAVTTHPEFIRAVVRLCKEGGARVLIGDSPGGMVKIGQLYEQNGIAEIAQQENAELVKFDAIVHKEGIPFAKIMDEVDVVISLPKFKTHSLTKITAAVKNVFGLVPGLYKVECHRQAPNHKVFAKMLAKIYGIVRPHLTIVDAVSAMDGEGPSAGNPYPLGLVVASADAVAVDAVLAKIIGIDPLSVATTYETHSLGLGTAQLTDIDICGEPLESVAVKNFTLPKILALYRLPNGIIRNLVRFIPLIIGLDRDRCNACGMCKNICPQQAIEVVTARIKMNARRCILCLCCCEICPQNALYLRFLHRKKKYEKQNTGC